MDKKEVERMVFGTYMDRRLDLLMVSPEYENARGKLTSMWDRLCDNEELTEEEITYVENLHRHLNYIIPHCKMGIVDGEECRILYLTSVPDEILSE